MKPRLMAAVRPELSFGRTPTSDLFELVFLHYALMLQAFPGEEAEWRASRAEAIRYGNIEDGDGTWVAFLVALTDRRRRGK